MILSFSRLKFRRLFSCLVVPSKIFSLIFRWQHRNHLYLIGFVLILSSIVSNFLPFGLIYSFRHAVGERPSVNKYRDRLIAEQKLEQKSAFDWLKFVSKNVEKFPQIISNETFQTRFYDFIQILPIKSNRSSFSLFEQPKRFRKIENDSKNDEILISILFSQKDTDYRQGRFYVGQVLSKLLQNLRSGFIVTLCENENSEILSSETIDLIRRLVPVFVVKTFPSENIQNIYEREKQAHLQCILANFQSFPTANFLLLLQDDAEPIGNDFYERIRSLIDTRVKKQWPSDGSRSQPAFLKIYHPRWLIDYRHPSFYMIVQLLSTSLFLTGLIFSSIRIGRCLPKKKSSSADHRSRICSFLARFSSIEYNFLHVFVYFLLITSVLILLNHSNVSWRWRSLHPSFYAIYPAPSCCLPGVIYFRSTYLQVIDYLNKIECNQKYAIDTAFDDLPRNLSLETYLIEPNLVHHIGLYSRLHNNYINPYLLD